jgi:tyrosinase
VKNLVTEEGAMRDYITNILLDAMAIGDSPTVYLFDGPPSSDDPRTWQDCNTLLGQRTFLVKANTGGEDNVAHGVVRGTVPLNKILMERAQSGQLSGLSNDEVGEYLTEHMEWCVVKVRDQNFWSMIFKLMTIDRPTARW